MLDSGKQTIIYMMASVTRIFGSALIFFSLLCSCHFFAMPDNLDRSGAGGRPGSMTIDMHCTTLSLGSSNPSKELVVFG